MNLRSTFRASSLVLSVISIGCSADPAQAQDAQTSNATSAAPSSCAAVADTTLMPAVRAGFADFESMSASDTATVTFGDPLATFSLGLDAVRALPRDGKLETALVDSHMVAV